MLIAQQLVDTLLVAISPDFVATAQRTNGQVVQGTGPRGFEGCFTHNEADA